LTFLSAPFAYVAGGDMLSNLLGEIHSPGLPVGSPTPDAVMLCV
jgi:hypothetical protein